MKQLIVLAITLLLYTACSTQTSRPAPSDGFYEVMALGNETKLPDLSAHEVALAFDTLFHPGDHTNVVIDTSDFVPLELDSLPTATGQMLSLSLTPKAAEKIRSFTATRVMKQVVVVIDGKAITMNKIREAITGKHLQITRSGDNACQYLLMKMKRDVRS